MAKVPVRTYQVGVPDGQVAPLANVGEAGVLGQMIGRAGTNIAGNYADYEIRREDVADRIDQVKRDQDLSQLQAEATIEVQEAAQAAITGADPGQAEDVYQDTIRNNLMPKWRSAAGKDEGLANELGRRMDIVARSKNIDVRGAALRYRAQSATGRLSNTLDTLSRAGGLTSTDAERDEILFQADEAIRIAVSGGAVRADQGESQGNLFRANMDEMTARRMIQQDPARGIAALADAGRFTSLEAEKRQQLSEYAQRASEADTRQREADVQRNVALERSERASADAWYAADLERALRDGSKGLKDIEAARSEGRLTPSSYDELSTVWESTQRGVQEQAETDARVADAVAGKTVLDPRSAEDRKAVDAYWRSQSRGVPADQQQALAETIVSKTGIIPPTLAGQLNGAVRGDAKSMAWAADSIARMERSSPAAVGDLPTETTRPARVMMAYLNAGVNPEDAAKLVDRDMQVSDPLRKARETQMRAGGLSSPIELAWTWASGTGDGALRSDQGFFEGGDQGLEDPELSLPVRTDFEMFYASAYGAHGNDAASRAEAISEVKKRWSVTDADGNRRWMRYAPERVYGMPSASIGEQLAVQVAPLVGEDAGELAGRLSIASDPMTARARTANARPTYAATYFDKNGLLQQVIAPDGSPFRFRPEPQSPEDESTKRAASVKELQGIRATRMAPGTYAPGSGDPLP